MVRWLVRWLGRGWLLLVEAVTGRRLAFVLLLASLAAHAVCVAGAASGDLAVEFRRELFALLLLSAALTLATFATGRVARVRAAVVARAATLAVAVTLLAEPPVFFVALLFAPLLIEPLLYDNQRIGMALSGALFAGILALLWALAGRAPDGPPAAVRYLTACALATGLPAGLGWAAAFHRERVVDLSARLRTLDSTVGRLARANREFQAYAGTVRSESAAEERQQDYPRAARHGRLCTDQRHRHDGRRQGTGRRSAGHARLAARRRTRSERARAQ